MSTIDAPERAAKPLEGPAPRLLVIQAPYYEQVVGGMRRGAERVFAEVGAFHQTVDVAGGFELPAALRMALTQTREAYDGYLLLGCVVRGETDHYTFICDAICHGVMRISDETGAAIGFGLLTVDTLQQAIARAADDRHNKGAEAAHALLAQVALRRRWGL
ncbi:6,7-dimethyl-8-ribityllumazine synthase [Paracraurococcus ruber]|uniref:6,7-dimethyl-8-ribityllumazine synthase n=1 Tax=Paracraurococcus ruber TaxID=77675 RepID=A0ABS1CZZ2_9PROT|nr:6,7-dimethyl-8-ribityllumazine synthase [Paracraurococcus ruber]MBK1660024.1 6,7-dimethyl-8-ribityllumazine synthase [Paracraurococcus ruber]TDG28654.1 6,7-dimethyl-8-ribityllumazine synthase [Paracraurococcus ruber]